MTTPCHISNAQSLIPFLIPAMQYPQFPAPHSYLSPRVSELASVPGAFPPTIFSAPVAPSLDHANPFSNAPSQNGINVPFNLTRYQGVPLSNDFAYQFLFRWMSDQQRARQTRQYVDTDEKAMAAKSVQATDLDNITKTSSFSLPTEARGFRHRQEEQYRGPLTAMSLSVLNWFCASMCANGKKDDLLKMLTCSDISPLGVMLSPRDQVMDQDKPRSYLNKPDVRTLKLALEADTFDLWGGVCTNDRLFFTVCAVDKEGFRNLGVRNGAIRFILAAAEYCAADVRQPERDETYIMILPSKASVRQNTLNRRNNQFAHVNKDGTKLVLEGACDLNPDNGVVPLFSWEVGAVNLPPRNADRWAMGGTAEPPPVDVLFDTAKTMHRSIFVMWVNTAPPRVHYHNSPKANAILDEAARKIITR